MPLPSHRFIAHGSLMEIGKMPRRLVDSRVHSYILKITWEDQERGKAVAKLMLDYISEGFNSVFKAGKERYIGTDVCADHPTENLTFYSELQEGLEDHVEVLLGSDIDVILHAL